MCTALTAGSGGHCSDAAVRESARGSASRRSEGAAPRRGSAPCRLPATLEGLRGRTVPEGADKGEGEYMEAKMNKDVRILG